ncbi:MAG: M14 family metallopeptidase [Myxococcota bacterium]|nr:M14 family metallopeptidase [Myxococcota bacterium]
MIALLLLLAAALADDYSKYFRWADGQEVVPHDEPEYHFIADMHARIRPLVEDRPGVVRPFIAGRTVEKRPIWAFEISDPTEPIREKMLVFAGIHALEWVGVESAVEFLIASIEHPPPGVQIVVLPVLNVDKRLLVEADLLAGDRVYRRSNMNGVDLNRDFAVNRESQAIWRHILPDRYATSPGPLSQPESQAIDALADAYRFDVSVSLHCFGGYIYTPWSGLFERPPHHAEHTALGRVMQDAQRGGGAWAYQVKELSRWGFFFRALGSELDHLYAQYGTMSFLIEMSRSGMEWHDRSTWKDPFRMYNPADRQPHTDMGADALRAMSWHLSFAETDTREAE